MASSVRKYVLDYFKMHSGDAVTPGAVTRYVGEVRAAQRDLSSSRGQSAGAVRAAIVNLVDEGLVRRVDGFPLRYQLVAGTRREAAGTTDQLMKVKQDPSEDTHLFTVVVENGTGAVISRQEIELQGTSGNPDLDAQEALREALRTRVWNSG